MPGSMDFAEDRFREIVERCLRLVLSAGASLPAEDEDWDASGALDSMSHVDALLCIEKASSLPDLFARLEGDPPRTTQSVLAALRKLVSEHELAAPAQALTSQPGLVAPVGIAGWGFGVCVKTRFDTSSILRLEEARCRNFWTTTLSKSICCRRACGTCWAKTTSVSFCIGRSRRWS